MMKILKTLSRVYTENNFDSTLAFYETLLGEKQMNRFRYKEYGLELASVGTLLIIGGSAEALKPFRETACTFLVDSIHECKTILKENGCEILREIQRVPTGYNMTARHVDGTIAEYVEFA